MSGKHILFLGTHGQYNIGDELLLETFLARLGNNHTYTINSYDPAYTQKQLAGRYCAEVFDTSGSRLPLLHHIWQCDLLFFGGGSIIKELYASVGRHPYATLLMVLAIVTFAKQVARKPIIMSNIGVGPLATPRGRDLARLILSQVDLVAVRDHASYDLSRALGIDPAKLIQTPDAVFANSPATLGITTRPPAAPGVVKIALNLNHTIENPANWEPFLANLAHSLRVLNQERPLEIHALPMQTGFKDHDDRTVLADFRTRLPEVAFVDTFADTPLGDATEVARIIAGCDVVVAERLHALVIAAILHKPFVALAYDVKVSELAEYLGMGAFTIDINQPFAAATLTSHIATVYEQRAALRQHLATRTAAASRALDDYFGLVNRAIAAPSLRVMGDEARSW